MSRRDRMWTGSSNDRAAASSRCPQMNHDKPSSAALQTRNPLSSPFTGTADTGLSTELMSISFVTLPSAAEMILTARVSANVTTRPPLPAAVTLLGMPSSGITVTSASVEDEMRNNPQIWKQWHKKLQHKPTFYLQNRIYLMTFNKNVTQSQRLQKQQVYAGKFQAYLG